MLAEGTSVADIARKLRRPYHVIWSEARKLMAAAEVVTPMPIDVFEHSMEIDVLELFSDLQTLVPEHLRR